MDHPNATARPSVPAALACAALILAVGACATSKLAPPPSMGDLSGAWILETDGRPIRIVQAAADTIALTVSPEPVMVRQGGARSDSTITFDIRGIVVAGVAEVSKRPRGEGAAELVTAGSLEGQVTFFAPMLVFTGTWSGDSFTGTFRVDPEREDVAVLDGPREWRLRRIAGRH